MKENKYKLYNKKEKGFAKKNMFNPNEVIAIMWEAKYGSSYSKSEAEFMITLLGKNWEMIQINKE